MIKGTVFQGLFMHKGNENKLIVLNVECGCGCRNGVAAYVPEGRFDGDSHNGEVGGSLTVEECLAENE